MRIALAQVNSVLGDFEGNRRKILEFTDRARQRRCDLVVFPEAALFGYHPVDLLERPSIVAEQELELRRLHRELPRDTAILVGAIVRNRNRNRKGKAYWNAAVFLAKGKPARYFPKTLLPTYDVFDEGRHIEPGDVTGNVFRFRGLNILVTVCEDMWAWPRKGNPLYSAYGRNPLESIKKGRVDIVVNMSASPFTHAKMSSRLVVARSTARHFKAPLIYVNMVGAQDELIFDGGSFVLDPRGRVIGQSVRFSEDLNVYDSGLGRAAAVNFPAENQIEETRAALVLGIKDFIRKTGFTNRVHFGLSGGIDSAVVACLAADAVGPHNATAVYMHGPFSSETSRKESRELASRLRLKLIEIPITGIYERIVSDLEVVIGRTEFGIMQENIQARIRGLLLMALGNRDNSLLLGTSNKSEMATGYCTLYGDLVGGLEPIGDLLKTEVVSLARYYNSEYEVIPAKIVERPPTAELRPNQVDQDTLPPYDQLDRAVRKIAQECRAPDGEIESRVLAMMFGSEFKRWQAPPILKVSEHAFGRGRRFPVAHKARK